MKKDRLFRVKKEKNEPFSFNQTVADVFDDMLLRSVPLYAESITHQAELCAVFYQDNSLIYDLGCSNGNLGLKIIDRMKDRRFGMIAVDSSLPMINTYARRLEKNENQDCVKLVCGCLEDIRIKNASVVLINLTLQFIEPENRLAVLSEIYEGLKSQGVVILTEKIVHNTSLINELQNHFYKQFKMKNGYSELEISQKREALEQVLRPDTLETHINRLKQVGFNTIDIWLKWFNFVSLIAIKGTL
jgi:tRNA (cmo5U34)-methyltransferase